MTYTPYNLSINTAFLGKMGDLYTLQLIQKYRLSRQDGWPIHFISYDQSINNVFLENKTYPPYFLMDFANSSPKQNNEGLYASLQCDHA